MIRITLLAFLLCLAPAARSHAQACSGVSTAYLPTQSTFGELIFEDNFPDNGDLDFNDQVIAYNYVFTLDDAHDVVQMQATYDVLAVGAALHNGLYLNLDGLTWGAVNGDVTVTVGTTTTTLTPGSSGDELVLPLTADTRLAFPSPGNTESFINTDASQPTQQAMPITLLVTFHETTDLATMEAALDLFIARTSPGNSLKLLEIHALPFQGTGNMDMTLFHVPNSGPQHFTSLSGLPFALNVPETFSWPLETDEISEGYHRILGFAQGNGDTGWYGTTEDPAALFVNGAPDSPGGPLSLPPEPQPVSAQIHSCVIPEWVASYVPFDITDYTRGAYGVAINASDSVAAELSQYYGTLQQGGDTTVVFYGQVHSINSSGVVVGDTDTATVSGGVVTVTPLGPIGAGEQTTATGINDASNLVGLGGSGYGLGAPGTVISPIYWASPTSPAVVMQDLGYGADDLGYRGDYYGGLSINNHGVIAGNLPIADGTYHAVRWDDYTAAPVILPELCPGGIPAYSPNTIFSTSGDYYNSISDDGTIAGNLNCDGGNIAVTWSAAGELFLPPPLGEGGASAFGISPNGLFIAGSANPGGLPMVWFRSSTTSTSWTPILLPQFPVGEVANTAGVNNSGVVIGTSYVIIDGNGVPVPIRWDPVSP